MQRNQMDGLYDPFRDDAKHMSIPSVIIVPRRECRVTSSMAQHYRDMPGAGAEISPSRRGIPEGRSKSKPWQVDMMKKSYTSKRRFRRSGRSQSSPLPPPPPAPVPPPISVIVCDGSPEVDGSWGNKDDSDSGYPSDEEKDFDVGFSSRNSSPAGSTQSGGSTFGGIVLKGRYGSSRSRRFRRV